MNKKKLSIIFLYFVFFRHEFLTIMNNPIGVVKIADK